MAAETAKMTAETERDRYKMMYEEATDVDTVGTTIGAAGRALAARIMYSVMGATDRLGYIRSHDGHDQEGHFARYADAHG